jgi:hypothetical protein
MQMPSVVFGLGSSHTKNTKLDETALFTPGQTFQVKEIETAQFR